MSPKIISDIRKQVVLEEEKGNYKKQEDAHMKWDTYNLKSVFKLIRLFEQHRPDQKVIIRPHPAEDPNTYKRFSRKNPNVEVVSSQGSSRPWILASDILIHTGCATGSEAVAMDHPTISIQERGSDLLQFRITNHVSCLTHTAKEAYQMVQDFYAGKLKLGDKSKLKEFWPAQEGKFASERIADEIHQFYLELGGAFEVFKLGFSDKFRLPKNFPDEVYRKMLVELPEVEYKLGQISQQLPSVSNIELHEICTNVFYIRPA